jgi:hypothetical protein
VRVQVGRSSAVCAGIAALLCAACTSLPARTLPPGSLEESVAVYGKQVAALRDLSIDREVPAGVQGEAELRDAMRTLLLEDWGPEDDDVERAYKLFGLLPAAMDLRSYLIDLYTAQVAGYYDPKSKRFFVRTGDGGGMLEDATAGPFVITHEFTHALQDQHFDLLALDESLKTRADQSMALQGLTEGDAMLAAIDHSLWQFGFPMSSVSPLGRALLSVIGAAASRAPSGDDPQMKQLREAPPVLRENLTFPYVDGMEFAAAVRSEFGQAGLDRAFRDDLPDSTEQIFHPERYLDRRDRPVQIALAAPPPGFTASSDQTLGMLDLRVLLETYLRSARAAEGWDGDRYVVWRGEGGDALAWVSAWDHEWQARRFERAYRRVLERKRGDAGFAVVRRGLLVAAVEGLEAERAQAEAERMLESRIERAPDDRAPLALWQRALRFPLAFERLDRVGQLSVLGGRALKLRAHAGGHLFELASGLARASERTPDRSSFSTLAGLVWASSDRTHDYRAAVLPIAFSFHARGDRAVFELIDLGILPAVLSVRTDGGQLRFALFGLLRASFGSAAPPEPAAPPATAAQNAATP